MSAIQALSGATAVSATETFTRAQGDDWARRRAHEDVYVSAWSGPRYANLTLVWRFDGDYWHLKARADVVERRQSDRRHRVVS